MEGESRSAEARKPNRFRFSLKSLLTLVLIASAYYAGRAPMVHRMQRAEEERSKMEEASQELKKRVMNYESLLDAERRKRAAWDVRNIERGMMVDSIEHQQRFK